MMMRTLLGNQVANQLGYQAHKTGKYHHAYLIWGEEGSGKQTFTQWFAQGIVCIGSPEGKTHQKPCGVCGGCKKFEHGVHPDVIILPKGTKPNDISVEEIRKLRRDCVIKPHENRYKIYIVPQLQYLTSGAMAAFLKTLEQPPPHVLFLMTATQERVLPDTIRSRLLSIPLYPLSDKQVHEELEQRFPDEMPTTLTWATTKAKGYLGQAVTLINQHRTQQHADHYECAELYSQLIQQKQPPTDYRLLQLLAPYEKDKNGFSIFLQILIVLLGNSLRQLIEQDQSSMFNQKMIGKLVEIVDEVESCRQKLKIHGNMNLLVSYFCMKTHHISCK